jgi:hypothetical protein
MKKRQVIILWSIAIALGAAVATVKLSQNQSTHKSTKRVQGQTLFESFPASDVATIEIKGAGSEVTLTKKDGKWGVADRDGYPANSTFANDFVRTLSELKVTLAMEAGPSFAPRFGMDEAATKADERGLNATFKDSSGKEIAKVSLGKSISSNDDDASPMGGGSIGRYVRNHADESGFYAVSEMFPSVNAEPKRWLAAGFISPEKIKSITLSEADKTDTAWKLTRETEEAEYKLEGATATEALNTTVTSPLKSLFSYSNFDDVVPASKVAERIEKGKRTAIIETFEGFTYTLEISPTKPTTPPPGPVSPDITPPAADNYLVKVTVAAELPKERKKEKDEKPDDAKIKDRAFEDRAKDLNEKLTKEKALAGVTFEVAKSTVEPLLKDRAALTATTTPANNSGDDVQTLRASPISSPPVGATLPPQEEDEFEKDENDE